MDANLTTVRIDIVSDVICPWCYIGKRQLELALPMLARDGLALDVHWRAYQLNPDMPPGGVERNAYRQQKFGSLARSQELDAQVAAAGAAVGLDIHHALMRRTPNTVAAHRVIWLADRHGVQNPVQDSLFRGYFVEGRDLGDFETLVELAERGGLPANETAALLACSDGAKEVLEEDAGARASGLNGVPTFTMMGHVLFSGAVPADTMAEAFVHAWRVLGRNAA